MTWGELKKLVEVSGALDTDEIKCIDVGSSCCQGIEVWIDTTHGDRELSVS